MTLYPGYCPSSPLCCSSGVPGVALPILFPQPWWMQMCVSCMVTGTTLGCLHVNLNIAFCHTVSSFCLDWDDILYEDTTLVGNVSPLSAMAFIVWEFLSTIHQACRWPWNSIWHSTYQHIARRVSQQNDAPTRLPPLVLTLKKDPHWALTQRGSRFLIGSLPLVRKRMKSVTCVRRDAAGERKKKPDDDELRLWEWKFDSSGNKNYFDL